MEKTRRLDLVIFWAEGFAVKPKLHKEIDRIYKKDKYEYYKKIKNSIYLEHKYIQSLSLLEEEYIKKVIGIILFISENDDNDLFYELYNLLKIGYPQLYNYLEKNEVIDIREYIQSFIKKSGGIKNVNNTEINSNINLMYIYCINLQKEIVQNEFILQLQSGMIEQLNHYTLEEKTSIKNYKYFNAEQKELIHKLKKILYKNIGHKIFDLISLQDFIHRVLDNSKFKSNYYLRIQFMLDLENISSSIYENIDFNNKEFEEILYVYSLQNSNIDFTSDIENLDIAINIDDLLNYIIVQIYIRYGLKAYKQVKKHYFKNNKETQFLELEEKEKEIKKIKIKSDFLENDFKNYKKTAEEKEKEIEKILEEKDIEIKRLKQMLELEKNNSDEITSLRKFIFELDKEIEYANDEKIDNAILENAHIAIVGGHSNWQNKMKTTLKNAVFISADMYNFDTKILHNVDHVFVNINYLGHALYYKTISSNCGKLNFINEQNENIVLKKIEKIIKK